MTTTANASRTIARADLRPGMQVVSVGDRNPIDARIKCITTVYSRRRFEHDPILHFADGRTVRVTHFDAVRVTSEGK